MAKSEFILDPNKRPPYGRIGIGSWVAFDIAANQLDCKIGKVVAIENEALWRIETPTKDFVRNLLYDINKGKAKIIDPYLMESITNVTSDFKELENWVKEMPERYKKFINKKEEK